MVVKEICDHRKDDRAIPILNGFTTSKNGNRTPKQTIMMPKQTTIGCQLLVEWKDGSSDWSDLKDLKESNPVEVAEHVAANKTVGEPAFMWWVVTVLDQRNRIISKLKRRYWKTMHKFGIRVPKYIHR